MEEDLIENEVQAMEHRLHQVAQIFSSVVALAFVALCVWLIIRIANRRERWAKRTLAITLCLPVLYVLSFGPAAWLETHGYFGTWWTHCCEVCFYYPLIWAQQNGPDAVRDAVVWYAGFWTG